MVEHIKQMNSEKPENNTFNREQRHELMNILSIIIANAEFAGEDLENTKQMLRLFERIIKACRLGEELVQRVCNPDGRGKKHEVELFSAQSSHTRFSRRILVVDSEASLVDIICRYLLKEGFDVQGVTDANLAWDMLFADPFQFDLVIADQNMPLLSGIDLSRKLYELRPELPVIMVTGYDPKGANQRSYLGVRDLLLKPLDRHKLLTAVHRLLTP